MANDRGAEQRPREEFEAAQGPMVTRAEMSPVVENPNQRLKLEATKTVFPEGLIQSGIDAIQGRQAETVIFRRIIETSASSDNPHTITIFEAVFHKPTEDTQGDTYIIDLVGEPWNNVVEKVDEGSILKANYKGRFRRRPVGATENGDPLVKEGDIIEPGGTIGLAKSGKGPYYKLGLPKQQFPQGGRVLRFLIADEEPVEPTSVIAHIEPIKK